MKERYNMFSCAHQVRMPTIENFSDNWGFNRRNTQICILLMVL